jgi:hypothetical protein
MQQDRLHICEPNCLNIENNRVFYGNIRSCLQSHPKGGDGEKAAPERRGKNVTPEKKVSVVLRVKLHICAS